MRMLLAISWRNIWRHPGRSGVLAAAIIAGLWAGIVLSSWTNGLIEQRFNRLIQEELTHLQVHHPEFLTEREPQMFIEAADEIFLQLENDDRVNRFTGRTLVEGMAQSPLTASGVQIYGLLPEPERETTTFHENLVEGEYIDSAVRYPVLIGRALSDRLNIGIGNRIVLTFQDLDNELTSGAFNITGIYQTGVSAADERKVYVRSDDLSELIAGRPVFHEIAVLLHQEELSSEMAADLNRSFPNVTAETWYELSPELRLMNDIGGSFFFYIMVIILIAVTFGILNTMLMAIFERMRELGMLMAVGMSKLRVFSMIMLESVMLTLSGAAVGMVLSYLTVEYLQVHGLDLTRVGGDTLAEWGYDALVYPFVNPEDYITVTLLVIAASLVAAVYPAIKALRLNPAEVVKDK